MEAIDSFCFPKTTKNPNPSPIGKKFGFRCVDRAFRVPPFGNWWMGWRFTTSFGAEKKQETFSDFLLGGAAGGRLVFSFESSGQGGPMMK